MSRITTLAKAQKENWSPVVMTDVVGWKECSESLNQISKKFPDTFRKALGAEIKNLKLSIAATLYKYQITRYTPIPNLIEARRWKSLKFKKRSPVTERLHGAKHRSALARPSSVAINGYKDHFEIGHFGRLGEYASRFQDGIPRQIGDPDTRRWMYSVLNPAFPVHDYATLVGLIAPVSPPRPYIVPLAVKTGRDFFKGLAKCLDRIVSGEMKKAERKATKRIQTGKGRKWYNT